MISPSRTASTTLLPLLLVLTLSSIQPAFSLHHSTGDGNGTISVYEILPKYGLPGGLLPDSVTSYSLAPDGRFSVAIAHECYIQFDYLVYYKEEITGKLSYGSISDLKGIQVQRFFLWFDVDEIKVDLPPSDSIYFQVGLINKRLDVGQFQSARSCRDGVATFGLQNLLQLPASVDDEVEMLVTG